MSAFAILRIRKRNGRAWAEMARHALRQGGRRVTNADPARGTENEVMVGPRDAGQAVAEISAALPAKRRKDAVEVIELLITASPEVMRKASPELQRRYFKAALDWVAARFGGAQNIKLAVVHRDESTPHLQVLVVPLRDGKLQGNAMIGGPAGLRTMQTEFAHRVGEPFGLVRGLEVQPGEKRAPYQSVRRWYAAIAAAGGEDQIPPAAPIPPLPPEPQAPGLLASQATRDAYAAALAERQRAQEAREVARKANIARQERIERLARLGLATYGKAARGLGEQIAARDRARREAAAAIETARRAGAAISAGRDELNKINREIEERRDALQLGKLEEYRDQLADQIREYTGLVERHRQR
ncbi:MAG: MobV family relaxase [Rubrivivax sp.]